MNKQIMSCLLLFIFKKKKDMDIIFPLKRMKGQLHGPSFTTPHVSSLFSRGQVLRLLFSIFFLI